MTGRGLVRGSGSIGFAGARIRDPRPPGGNEPWYAEPVTVRKVDENSTAQTSINTTAEVTVSSLTLPALVLSSTGAARLSATGTINKNTAGTVTFRIKVADQSSTDTVLATSGVTVDSSTDPHAWMIEALFLGKQPSVNRGWGIIDIASAGAGGTLKPSTFSAVGFSTMGLNEADAWTVSITAQMSAASTGFSVTRQVSVLEGVN